MSDLTEFGFDKLLNKSINDASTSVVYDTVENALNTGSILQGGNLTLKTLSIGGLVRQVAPGDDIQAAIDAVSREGGGIVQLLAKTYTLNSNINLKNKVLLLGAGKNSTTLNFVNTNFGIKAGVAYGASITGVSLVTDFGVKDLTVSSSASTAAVDIDYTSSFVLENLSISGTTKGIRISRSNTFNINKVDSLGTSSNGFEILGDNNTNTTNFSLTNCSSDGNGANGFYFNAAVNRVDNFILINCESSSNTSDGFALLSSGGIIQKFTLINCASSSNTGNGFSFAAGSNKMYFGSLIACRASTNTVDGFDFSASASSSLDTSVINCITNGNSGIGFDGDGNCQRVSFNDCFADTNTGDGFEIAGTECSIVNCYGGDPIDLQGAVRYVGNSAAGGASTDPKTMVITAETDTISYANQNENTRTRRLYQVMKNTSGSGLRNGNVVVLQSVTTGDEITTTTTGGDNKVFGVVTGTNANNGWSVVLTEGYTTNLYVSNIAASIAVGDWLSTFTAAYYAKKAVTGDMAFAIALEAPSTGTALLDALILPPRLL